MKNRRHAGIQVEQGYGSNNYFVKDTGGIIKDIFTEQPD